MPTPQQFITANDYGTFGVPNAVNRPADVDASSRWLGVNYQFNLGSGDFSDTAMFREFRTPEEYEQMGVRIVNANYRDIYRQEATRLRVLGFEQVDKPKFAATMLELFRQKAAENSGEAGISPLPVSEDSARFLTDQAKNFNFQYVSDVAGGIATGIGNITAKTGETVQETVGTVGKVLSNPFTPPLLLAGLGVGVFLFLRR